MIIAQLQSGDKEIFGIIIDRYEGKLVGYATRLIQNHDMAEDAVQEAFMKSYRDIHSFDIRRKFSSWIYRIVHNEAISQVRKVSRNDSLEDVFEIPSGIDVASEISKKLDIKSINREIDLVMKKLSLKYREVVLLRFYEDKTYDEISEILHLPVNTVGTYISRAKKEFKKNLQNVNIEEYL